MSIPKSAEPTAAATTADDEQLITWLSTHHEECPSCGYGLHGLVSAVCPECGKQLVLSVRTPRMTLWPWVLSIAFFCMAAGFDLVMSILLGVEWANTVSMWYPTIPQKAGRVLQAVILMAVAGALMVGAAGWVACRRKRWTRSTTARQWMECVSMFGGIFTGHIGLGYFVWVLLD